MWFLPSRVEEEEELMIIFLLRQKMCSVKMKAANYLPKHFSSAVKFWRSKKEVAYNT